MLLWRFVGLGAAVPLLTRVFVCSLQCNLCAADKNELKKTHKRLAASFPCKLHALFRQNQFVGRVVFDRLHVGAASKANAVQLVAQKGNGRCVVAKAQLARQKGDANARSIAGDNGAQRSDASLVKQHLAAIDRVWALRLAKFFCKKKDCLPCRLNHRRCFVKLYEKHVIVFAQRCRGQLGRCGAVRTAVGAFGAQKV